MGILDLLSQENHSHLWKEDSGLLGNMAVFMKHSFASHIKYDEDSPKQIISLWMNILISLPDWNVNNSASFLIDILCSHSFFNPPIHLEMLRIAKDLHQKCLTESTAGFISWITGVNYFGSKLLFPASTAQFPWLAYFFLQAEDTYCRQTSILSELVKQFSEQKQWQCETSPPWSSQHPIKLKIVEIWKRCHTLIPVR